MDFHYVAAFDKDKSIVKAIDAEKISEYTCCICDNIVKLKKSDGWKNGEVDSRRPHFYHPNLSPNCKPETALHYCFKVLLFNKIRSRIEAKASLPMSWKCDECFSSHSGNLLKKIDGVKKEFKLEICQPDISLFYKEKPTLAIEIIVTHPPEEKVLNYYSQNNISLITFKLNSDLDLDLIDAEILYPTSVSVCMNPKSMITPFGKEVKEKLLIPITEDIKAIQEKYRLERERDSKEKEKRELEFSIYRTKGYSILAYQNEHCFLCPIQEFKLDQFKESKEVKLNSTVQMFIRNEPWLERIYKANDGNFYFDLKHKKNNLIPDQESLDLINSFKVINKIPLSPLLKICQKCEHHKGVLNDHVLCSYLNDQHS